jgi:hypothetical protein
MTNLIINNLGLLQYKEKTLVQNKANFITEVFFVTHKKLQLG